MTAKDVAVSAFGAVEEGAARRFRLDAGAGVRVDLSDYGARIVAVQAPGRDGDLADIALGFDSAAAYERTNDVSGAICGRVAGRIAHARFPLDGAMRYVRANHGGHCLHGGARGFHSRLWRAEVDHARCAVRFLHQSPSGDQGFPGAVAAMAEYRLNGRTLELEMTATADAPTVVNLCNHAYWNLAGHDAGSVLSQTLRLYAPLYAPNDADTLPTGELRRVDDGPYDFRATTAIGDRASAAGPVGYDLFYPVAGEAGRLRAVAEARDPASGRGLRLAADQPGVQFYAGGKLDASDAKGGARYGAFSGFALETQGFPNAVNLPWLPTSRLEPGRTWRSRMRIAFFAA